jgi:NADPH:quinone reductase
VASARPAPGRNVPVIHTTAARLVRHGEPLRVEEVELPDPGPGEVVVTLSYAGVNPVDRYGAEGRVAADGPVPRTLGAEGTGQVQDRPVVVHGYGLGTRRDGLWAGAAVVPEAALIDLPEGVDPVAAATMGVAGVTAWRVVTELGRVGADDRVLVLGASGGVGAIAVSVAHRLGAEVWGQTVKPANAEWIARRGADHVVVAGAGDLAAATAAFAPTVVVDPLGDGFTGAAIEAMAPHGRLVIFGTSADPTGDLPLQALYRKGLTVEGYGGLIEPDDVLAEAIGASLRALAGGRFEVPVDAVVPLAEVNEALSRLASHGTRGKLVLDLAAG